MVRPNGQLIIGGTIFTVDAPIANWHLSGWDATSPYCIPTATERAPGCLPTGGGQYPYGPPPLPYTQRYAARPSLRSWPKSDGGMHPSYEAVKAVVKQFVVHHDGCASADMCFNVLQNERGLSVHFLIDNDGTIFQTIDLGLMAYHASDWNLYSIGVELCNRGDAYNVPNYYDSGRAGPRRKITPCKINGNTMKAFDYTPAQIDSFTKLCRELLRLLPNLPAEYPQSSPGEAAWDTMKDATIKRESYAGYVGHYHINTQKWDPGPFDFKGFCGKLRGALCFPVFPKLEAQPGDRDKSKPIVPDDSAELREASKALYALNEDRAEGGFFPVGPWGDTAMWHGGIHVVGKRDGGVYAPYPGRLVAARMGRESSIGSFNFVLLRHEMTLGTKKVQFYSLYMHLADETKRDAPAEWMTKGAWKASYKRGQVTLIDEPIEAGALIGHVGTVGPDALSRAQVHVEFFSEQLIEDPSYWQLIDGTAGGRFCDTPEIIGIIDQDKDGVLKHSELLAFYASGGGGQLHQMVTLHVSEWTAEPNWTDALRASKGFKSMKVSEIDALVAEQITPGLWWDAAVATHCRLPKDGVVHHYHPVAFIAWFKNQLIEAAAEAVKRGPKLDEKDIKAVPKSITDDLGDVSGASMRSTADVTEDACNKNLTLEQMVQGFDAPECTK
ncbi:MAG TPA: N-acetylmuramoyl-L-alanine amidase [Kofleriaceae bacterium]|nr:N-acetylmuramoyl-L-alanine amidase [Kofleriaceae bacterium]